MAINMLGHRYTRKLKMCIDFPLVFDPLRDFSDLNFKTYFALYNVIKIVISKRTYFHLAQKLDSRKRANTVYLNKSITMPSCT